MAIARLSTWVQVLIHFTGNLYENNRMPRHGIYEVDMKQVVQRKCILINTNHQLQSCLSGEVSKSKFHVDSEFYHLMSADIRNTEELNDKLTSAGMQKNIPTLFLMECVCVYLSPACTHKLLEYIANDFLSVMVVDYDPVNFNDRFGEVMKQNLRSRQCYLLGAQPDLKSKKQSYSMFSHVEAKLFVDVYHDLPPDEKQRVEKIEFLDEVNLLIDLLKHYCICWACKEQGNLIGLDNISL